MSKLVKSIFLILFMATQTLFAWSDETLRLIEKYKVQSFQKTIDLVGESTRGLGEANFSYALYIYDNVEKIAMDFVEEFKKLEGRSNKEKECFLNDYVYVINQISTIKIGIQIINNNDLSAVEKDPNSFIVERLKAPILMAKNLKNDFNVNETRIVIAMFAHQKSLLRGIRDGGQLLEEALLDSSSHEQTILEKVLNKEYLDSFYHTFNSNDENVRLIIRSQIRGKTVRAQLAYAQIVAPLEDREGFYLKSLADALFAAMYNENQKIKSDELYNIMISEKEKLVKIIGNQEYVEQLILKTVDAAVEMEDLY